MLTHVPLHSHINMERIARHTATHTHTHSHTRWTKWSLMAAPTAGTPLSLMSIQSHSLWLISIKNLKQTKHVTCECVSSVIVPNCVQFLLLLLTSMEKSAGKNEIFFPASASNAPIGEIRCSTISHLIISPEHQMLLFSSPACSNKTRAFFLAVKITN